MRTYDNLADELNGLNATPNVEDGTVDYSKGAVDDVECHLGEHPEGAKRGGYVPYATRGEEGAMWDHLDEKWVEDEEDD